MKNLLPFATRWNEAVVIAGAVLGKSKENHTCISKGSRWCGSDSNPAGLDCRSMMAHHLINPVHTKT